MSFGSTSGRGFENEFAPYVFGAIFVVTVVLWVVFHLQHRKSDKDDDDADPRGD
jgi:hypothetical protein